MASGSSIIANISNNLSNTYSYLASLYPEEGVTRDNITAARNDSTNYLTLNQSFASYLQNLDEVNLCLKMLPVHNLYRYLHIL